MPEKQNPLDSVADDLFSWLNTESTYYANALREGGRAPFAAPISEKEKADTYRRQIFQTDPDGTVHYDRPNAQGRNALIQRLGTRGYAQVYDAVRPQQGRRLSVDKFDLPEPPDDEEEE